MVESVHSLSPLAYQWFAGSPVHRFARVRMRIFVTSMSAVMRKEPLPSEGAVTTR
jgi:hypothetical protein